MIEHFRNYGILTLSLLVLVLLLPLNSSLWLDETITYWIIRDGLSGLYARAVTYQGQSPFYYFVIWCISSVTGTSEISLRLPSAVFFLASALVLLAIGRRLFGFRTAVFAVLIFSCVNEVRIAAMSARPYSFALLLGLLSVFFLLRWLEGARFSDALWYIVTSVLTFYAHYLFSIVFLFHVVFFECIREKKISLKSYVLSNIGIAILCVPAFFQITSLIGRRQQLSIAPPPSTLSFLGALFPPHLVLIIALSVVLAGLFGKISWARMNSTEARPVLAVISLFLAPPFLFFVASQAEGTSFFLSRYFLLYSAGMALVFGAILGCVKEQARPVLVLALAGLLLFRESERKWQVEDWRGAAAEVQTLGEAKKIDALLFYPGLIEAMKPQSLPFSPEAEAYLTAPLQYYPVSFRPILLPVVMEGEEGQSYLRDRIDPVLADKSSVAILSLKQSIRRGSSFFQMPKFFSDFLERRGFRTIERRDFGMVEVIETTR